MSYEVIEKAIGKNGGTHVKFSQSTPIDRWARVHADGMCLGCVVNWLIARHKNENFLAAFEKPSESTSLLGETRAALSAAAIQSSAGSVSGVSWVQDMKNDLARGSMTFDAGQSNVVGSVRLSGVGVTIANLVLTGSARYFVVYMTGSEGAHVLGVHRPWSLIGKSSSSYVFDPNYGQFQCSNKAGLAAAIDSIGGIYGDEVARRYRIYGFTGSGW